MLPTICHSKLNFPPTQTGAAALSPQTLTSLCRSVQSGTRMKRTSPGHKRPSLLSSQSALPGLTSEVLLPYKWDKVFDNCWLKLKPNSQSIGDSLSACGRKLWCSTVDWHGFPELMDLSLCFFLFHCFCHCWNQMWHTGRHLLCKVNLLIHLSIANNRIVVLPYGNHTCLFDQMKTLTQLNSLI